MLLKFIWKLELLHKFMIHFKGVEAISDEIGYSGPEYPIVVNLGKFAEKTREPRLLMRFFLFQKIWKIHELLQRHFSGFFDRIMGNPSTEPISTISDFELLQSWKIKIPMKMHVLEWENSWATRKTRFGRFFDLFWSLGRLYNVYKKIFRNILFLLLFP